MTKEAMKLALEALEWEEAQTAYPSRMMVEAITALREALAEQEPVGHLLMGPKQDFVTTSAAGELEINVWHPVYTSPPAQRKPLTKEQMYELSNKANDDCMRDSDSQAPWSARPWTYHFVRAIEAHYGITGEKK